MNQERLNNNIHRIRLTHHGQRKGDTWQRNFGKPRSQSSSEAYAISGTLAEPGYVIVNGINLGLVAAGAFRVDLHAELAERNLLSIRTPGEVLECYLEIHTHSTPDSEY